MRLENRVVRAYMRHPEGVRNPEFAKHPDAIGRPYADVPAMLDPARAYETPAVAPCGVRPYPVGSQHKQQRGAERQQADDPRDDSEQHQHGMNCAAHHVTTQDGSAVYVSDEHETVSAAATVSPLLMLISLPDAATAQ